MNIGAAKNGLSPVIGDNVFIGSGVKVMENIHVASNTIIGAGAVVVKNVDEEYITWAGVPAKMINRHT